MPNYVTESSYTESGDVRSLVGTTTFAAEEWLLLDLETHEQFPLDLSELPGITDDPLAEFRKKDEPEEDDDPDEPEENGDSDGPEESEPKDEKKKPRPIRAWVVQWNDAGSRFSLLRPTGMRPSTANSRAVF